jgi:hypothetical protein
MPAISASRPKKFFPSTGDPAMLSMGDSDTEFMTMLQWQGNAKKF